MKKLKQLIIYLIFAMLLLPKISYAGEIGIDVGEKYSMGGLSKYLGVKYLRTTKPADYSLLGLPEDVKVLAVYPLNCLETNKDKEKEFYDAVDKNPNVEAVEIGNEPNIEDLSDKGNDTPQRLALKKQVREKIASEYGVNNDFDCNPKMFADQIIRMSNELKAKGKKIIFGGLFVQDVPYIPPYNYNMNPNEPNNSVTPYIDLVKQRFGNKKPWDAIALHFYVNEGGDQGDENYILDKYSKYIPAIKQKVGDLPIWVTEYGWRSNYKDMTEAKQAKFLKESTSWLKKNVGMAFWYSEIDTVQIQRDGSVNNNSTGLYNVGRPKLSYHELRSIQGSLTSCDTAGQDQSACSVAGPVPESSQKQSCKWCNSTCVDSTNPACPGAPPISTVVPPAATKVPPPIPTVAAPDQVARQAANSGVIKSLVEGDSKNYVYCVYLSPANCSTAPNDCSIDTVDTVKKQQVCLPKAEISEEDKRLFRLYAGDKNKFNALLTVSNNNCKDDQDCKKSVIAECASKWVEDSNTDTNACVRDHFLGIQTNDLNKAAQDTIERKCNEKPKNVPGYEPGNCIANNYSSKYECDKKNVYVDDFELCFIAARQEEVNRAKGVADEAARAKQAEEAVRAAQAAAQRGGAPAQGAPQPKSANDFCDGTDQYCRDIYDQYCGSAQDTSKCMSEEFKVGNFVTPNKAPRPAVPPAPQPADASKCNQYDENTCTSEVNKALCAWYICSGLSIMVDGERRPQYPNAPSKCAVRGTSNEQVCGGIVAPPAPAGSYSGCQNLDLDSCLLDSHCEFTSQGICQQKRSQPAPAGGQTAPGPAAPAAAVLQKTDVQCDSEYHINYKVKNGRDDYYCENGSCILHKEVSDGKGGCTVGTPDFNQDSPECPFECRKTAPAQLAVPAGQGAAPAAGQAGDTIVLKTDEECDQKYHADFKNKWGRNDYYCENDGTNTCSLHKEISDGKGGCTQGDPDRNQNSSNCIGPCNRPEGEPASPVDRLQPICNGKLTDRSDQVDCFNNFKGAVESSCSDPNGVDQCIEGLISGWASNRNQLRVRTNTLRQICLQSNSCYDKVYAACSPEPDKKDQTSFNNCVEDFQIHNPIKDRDWQVNTLNALCAHYFGPDNQTSNNCVSKADNQCKDNIIENDFKDCVNKTAEGLGAVKGQKILYKVTMNCPGASGYDGEVTIYQDGKSQDKSFTIPQDADRIACEVKEYWSNFTPNQDGVDENGNKLQTVIFTNKQPIPEGQPAAPIETPATPEPVIAPIQQSCYEEAREQEGGVVQNFEICPGKEPTARGEKYCQNGNPKVSDCSAKPGEECTYDEGEPFCPEGQKHTCHGIYNDQGVCQYKAGVEANCSPCQ